LFRTPPARRDPDVARRRGRGILASAACNTIVVRRSPPMVVPTNHSIA
jgi:hypothetical protein